MGFESKSILITGASSGIGNAIAIYLARQGYHVLASVRKQSDLTSLNDLGIENLKPLFPLDLTRSDQVISAATLVKEMMRAHQIPPLYAVINYIKIPILAAK